MTPLARLGGSIHPSSRVALYPAGDRIEKTFTAKRNDQGFDDVCPSFEKRSSDVIPSRAMASNRRPIGVTEMNADLTAIGRGKVVLTHGMGDRLSIQAQSSRS